MNYINGPIALPGSGYDTGRVSGAYTAFNPLGSPAKITALAPFNFDSAYFAAALDPGIIVTVTGKRDGVSIYSQSIAVQPARATRVFYDFRGVDELDLVSFGNGSPQFVLDNFTFSAAPEPSSVVLAAIALSGLAAAAFRKCRTG